MDDRLLKSDEAAQRLTVATQTLANWRSLRRGPRYVKVGSSIRYRESDLNLFLEQNTIRVREGEEVA